MMTLHGIPPQTLRVHLINYVTSTVSTPSDLNLHNDWTNGSKIGKMVKRMIVTILMMNYRKPEGRLDSTGGVMSRHQSSPTCGHGRKLMMVDDAVT